MKYLNSITKTVNNVPVKNLKYDENFEFITGIVSAETEFPVQWRIRRKERKAALSSKVDLETLPYFIFDTELQQLSASDLILDLKGIHIPRENKHIYTFRKDSWHAKYYHWITGNNANEVFKTMCPYFWTMIFFIILSPFVILTKATLNAFKTDSKTFSKFTSSCEKAYENYLIRKEEKRIKNAHKYFDNITDEEYYDFKYNNHEKKIKTFNEHLRELLYCDWDKYDSLKSRFNEIDSKIHANKNKERKARILELDAQREKEQEQLEQRSKELYDKIFNFLERIEIWLQTSYFFMTFYYGILFVLGIAIAFVLAKTLAYPLVLALIWVFKEVIESFLLVPALAYHIIAAILTTIIITIYTKDCLAMFLESLFEWLAKYIFLPLSSFFENSFSFIGKPIVYFFKQIGKFFKFLYKVIVGFFSIIWKLIVYTGDIMYNIYKNNCPRVIWVNKFEDE